MVFGFKTQEIEKGGFDIHQPLFVIIVTIEIQVSETTESGRSWKEMCLCVDKLHLDIRMKLQKYQNLGKIDLQYLI